MKVKSLKRKMSNLIQYDKCLYVSSMTKEGIKPMSPKIKMTRRQNVMMSLNPATRLIQPVCDCITSLCINPIFIDNENIFTLGNAEKVSGQFINYMPEIVYKMPFIYKCFNSANFNQNMSINKPKSARNQPFNKNLSKPIPKETTESRGQKMVYNKSALIKREFNNWLTGVYRPTHFLTVQLPENLKTANYYNSKNQLRMIMKIFEKSLLNRHWNKHHLPFIVFAENGASDDWHYHILLNRGKFTEQELQNAILKTTITLGLPFYCLQLEPIVKNEDNVKSYSMKEMKISWNSKFDSDRIILSADLFNLPYKTPSIES